MNLVIISSLASKCQHFKLRCLQFHLVKWLKIGYFNYKVLAFWSRWRYNYQIQLTRFFISLKSNIEMLVGVASLPHSRPPEYRHLTVETGKTVYTFATQCMFSKFSETEVSCCFCFLSWWRTFSFSFFLILCILD